jgi:hypothetical protein
LTTFSLANDVSKYFAILPALFAAAIPSMAALNVMQLSSPTNAVLSALIFNALIIPALIPLALRGVRFKPPVRPRCCAGTCWSTARRRVAAVRRDQADRHAARHFARSLK